MSIKDDATTSFPTIATADVATESVAMKYGTSEMQMQLSYNRVSHTMQFISRENAPIVPTTVYLSGEVGFGTLSSALTSPQRSLAPRSARLFRLAAPQNREKMTEMVKVNTRENCILAALGERTLYRYQNE